MSWLFSQVLVEEYLGDISLDGEQSVPLNGNNTQQAYCAPDKMTKFSRLSRFGMTYKPLTESLGEELLTLYLADFHAKTSAQRGGGAGITGERSGMWKHMARIIGEVRPKYVFVENSPMLTTRGLGVVLADLSQMGFDAKWGVISAADVGAPHLRERIWILATDTSFKRCNEWGGDWKERQLLHDINRDASESKPERERWQRGIGEIGSDVANSCDKGLQGSKQFQNDIGENIRGQTIPHGSITKRNNDEGTSSNWWDIEPNVGRVADGVAARVDRLKAIGNGQVPLCAATAWELLK